MLLRLLNKGIFSGLCLINFQYRTRQRTSYVGYGWEHGGSEMMWLWNSGSKGIFCSGPSTLFIVLENYIFPTIELAMANFKLFWTPYRLLSNEYCMERMLQYQEQWEFPNLDGNGCKSNNRNENCCNKLQLTIIGVSWSFFTSINKGIFFIIELLWLLVLCVLYSGADPCTLVRPHWIL